MEVTLIELKPDEPGIKYTAADGTEISKDEILKIQDEIESQVKAGFDPVAGWYWYID